MARCSTPAPAGPMRRGYPRGQLTTCTGLLAVTRPPGGLSLSGPEGSAYALIGANGAGKTDAETSSGERIIEPHRERRLLFAGNAIVRFMN